jgi:hypothetical protein
VIWNFFVLCCKVNPFIRFVHVHVPSKLNSSRKLQFYLQLIAMMKEIFYIIIMQSKSFIQEEKLSTFQIGDKVIKKTPISKAICMKIEDFQPSTWLTMKNELKILGLLFEENQLKGATHIWNNAVNKTE